MYLQWKRAKLATTGAKTTSSRVDIVALTGVQSVVLSPSWIHLQPQKIHHLEEFSWYGRFLPYQARSLDFQNGVLLATPILNLPHAY